MNKTIDCCLTLVCHKSMEEMLVDCLLEHPEWVSGFNIARIEGHSHSATLTILSEQVRGRAARIEIRTLMNQEDAQLLLAHLRVTMKSREIAYWISPVMEFGRLA